MNDLGPDRRADPVGYAMWVYGVAQLFPDHIVAIRRTVADLARASGFSVLDCTRMVVETMKPRRDPR
jgi:hypothetical protein